MKLIIAALFAYAAYAQTPQVLPPLPPEISPTTIPTSPTKAPTRTTWDIKSPLDLFTIEVESEGRGQIDGQDVSIAPLNRYMSVFGREFIEDCPRFKKKPEIEIVQSLGSEHRSWQLHPEQSVFVQNGKCLKVTSEEAHQFPIHRRWFTGPDTGEIDLGSRFTLIMEGTKVTFVKREGVWRAEKENANDKLLKKIIQAITRFKITARTYRRLPAGAPSLQIQVGSKSYRFHKISRRDWALELESPDWLVISSDFRVFRELSPESLLTATE